MAGLEEFIKAHHQQVVDETGNHPDVINVFAFSGEPTFGDFGSQKRHEFEVEFGIGGLTFMLRGYIDLNTLDIHALFSVRIPIVGTVRLADVNGNLTSGVPVTFGVPGVLSGTAKFFAKDKWLKVDFTATIFGQTYGPLTINLVPLPICDLDKEYRLKVKISHLPWVFSLPS